MDRDLAIELVELLGAIKTAIETIALNTTPADSEPQEDTEP